jgi:hypothetical protein
MLIGYIDADGFVYDVNVRPITNKLSAQIQHDPYRDQIRIIDERGNFLFEQNEKLVHKECVDPRILLGWSSLSTDVVFGRGKGILYKTNKRFIFIRNIDPTVKIVNNPFGYLPSLFDYKKAKELKSRGAKEFFQIDLNEIERIVKRSLFQVMLIYIQSDDKKKVRMDVERDRELYYLFEEFPHLKKGEKMK